MKKLCFLMAGLLIGAATYARELTFYLGDNVIEPNSTVTYNEIEEQPIGGGMKEVVITPPIYLTSDIYTSKLKVTATCTSGQTIRLCAGGNCVAGTSVTKENIKVQPNEKLELKFEYIGEIGADENVPTIWTNIEAQDGDYEATYKSFTIVLNDDGSGISLIENNARFVATEGGIKYDVDSASTVELFSLSGVKVLEREVTGTGIIATNNLERGIYLYAIRNSQGKTAGKIYIR